MKKKVFLSLLTALLLVLWVPTIAFAADGTECTAGTSCKEHTAAIGNTHYDSLTDAIAAAKNGDTIVLLKSVTENNVSFTKSGNYTLNLNGNTLESTAVGSDIIALRAADLTLTIQNGTLATDITNTYGIYAYNAYGTVGYDNLNLELDHVTIDCIDQALGVQGLNANQNVTVKNSNLICESTGIYFPPLSGVLTIENSQISAVDNAVVVKGGSVIIKGADTKLIATGVPEDQDKPYDGNTSGEGFPQTGSALYVEGGYKAAGNIGERPIRIQLEDGTFISENAAAVAVNHIKDQQVQKTEISGGIYSSDIIQFVKPEAVSAVVTSAGKNTYYIGNTPTVSARVSAAAISGDSISVLSGDVDLTINKDDVIVTNKGNGQVFADGHEVGSEPFETHAHVWGQPTGVREPSCTQEGYTGDKACTICSLVEKGTVLDKLPHNYQDGKCTVCGAADPNYKPAEAEKDDTNVPETGDSNPLALLLLALLISGAASVSIFTYNQKKA